ncbi:MAG: alpha-ketoacid dehydrogenase subunit beta [Rhizobiaceae bacterium]|nr:alpha-ketoacid dehydrogenase subunit beta [Rhizobiaceae bacterium]
MAQVEADARAVEAASVSFVEAARLAALQEMRRDHRVWVLGEDVARGGLFGQYGGFLDEFGPDRICSTPISESTIMGAGLGAALVGTRPIIEMRIFDFAMCAMDELVNQIAKIRYMFGGQAKPAVVVRMPFGIWRNSAAQHSQMLEAWFAHLPGVIVATPSTPQDEAGLLVSAIRCDDPVIMFEPKLLFTDKAPVADPIEPIPFGEASHLRHGNHLTIVTWSSMVPRCREAAEELQAKGVEADLIDLRTIWPWDRFAVCNSVARTRRLLVVHEAVSAAGFGAEIVAHVTETLGPGALRAVRRLGAPRVPVPFSPAIESEITISRDRIVQVALDVAGKAAA